MKTLFKSGVLVLGIMISVSSCSSCGNNDNTTSGSKIDTPKSTVDTSQKSIDTVKKTGAGTIKKDTVKK
jgi:hypothetical protein